MRHTTSVTQADSLPPEQITTTTLCEAFQKTARRFPDSVALRAFGQDAELTWADYDRRVTELARGLATLGVKRGDPVAMLLTNRPEAFIIDAAALHLGATPFSVYNTSSLEQVCFLLDHSDCRVVFTEEQFASRIDEARRLRPELEHVFIVDGEAAEHYEQLLKTSADGFDFDASWRAVSSDDVAVLIYTSGTTGPPKGVELTHGNLIAAFRSTQAMLPVPEGGRLMSYLPMAHLAHRVVAYYPALFTGSSITCAPDVRDALAALREVRPTTWMAPPRIWEKLQAALAARFETEPDHDKRGLIQTALRSALDRVRLEMAGEAIPEELLDVCARGDREVFQQVRAELGLDKAQLLLWRRAHPSTRA